MKYYILFFFLSSSSSSESVGGVWYFGDGVCGGEVKYPIGFYGGELCGMSDMVGVIGKITCFAY